MSPVSKVPVALAQMNATVGELSGSARRIVDAVRAVRVQGAVMMIAPELALSGAPQEDLRTRSVSVGGLRRVTQTLGARVGTVSRDDGDVTVGHPCTPTVVATEFIFG